MAYWKNWVQFIIQDIWWLASVSHKVVGTFCPLFLTALLQIFEIRACRSFKVQSQTFSQFGRWLGLHNTTIISFFKSFFLVSLLLDPSWKMEGLKFGFKARWHAEELTFTKQAQIIILPPPCLTVRCLCWHATTEQAAVHHSQTFLLWFYPEVLNIFFACSEACWTQKLCCHVSW